MRSAIEWDDEALVALTVSQVSKCCRMGILTKKNKERKDQLTPRVFRAKETKLDTTYGHTYQFSTYVQQVSPRKGMHMTHGITHSVQEDYQQRHNTDSS